MLKVKVLRSGLLIAVLILGLVPLGHFWRAKALTLPQRSLRLESSAPGENTLHIYNFDIPSNSLVGSTVFEYCTNDPFLDTPCDVPAGLDVSGANMDSESGDTGYVVDTVNTMSNRLVLTRAPVISNIGPAQYVFSNVVNPSDVGTVYLRVSLHAATDGTGPYSDGGGLAVSIARRFTTSAFVPPYLTFCVGVSVAPDCSSTSGNSINMGELSKTSPNAATSQFAAASNGLTGFFTNVFAGTMTSGNRIITPMFNSGPSLPGTGQFGFNMRANTNPSAGSDPSGIGDSALAPDYNVPNQFVMKSGVVTSSTVSSDFNVFTTTYVVNVPPDQPAGIYNTSVTYVATASF